jgi:hypothetical protein
MYEITMVSPGYAPKGWDGRLDGDVEVNFALEKMGPPPNAYIDGH